MAGTIRIRNLRNLRSLDFELPDQGVWLLTAANGGGKTSLLACIRRIGHSNAFPVHFPTSLQSDRLDNHLEGSVVYEIDGETVEYAYRGERWTPRPRSNSMLLDDFGYPSVTYIGATAERITPRSEDFDPRRVRPVHPEIYRPANEIFETQKFSSLRMINLAPGVGNDAFVMSLGGSPIKYHSERHFSLGELCVLKLLKLLRDVARQSLIIIDELEMALHPRAQLKLLRYLETQAIAKRLTIIFSTHSVTLLKSIHRNKIIFLENDGDGRVNVIRGCYPTYALGQIAYDEESIPDAVYYVEDPRARHLVQAMFERFANEEFPDPNARPTLKVAPIGGFLEVVKFLDHSRTILPEHCRQNAILDGDVADETLEAWRRSQNHDLLARFQRLRDAIHYLPWTPEIGVMQFVADNRADFQRALRDRFNDNQIQIRDAVARFDPTLDGAQSRNSAKSAYNEVISYLMRRTGRSEDQVEEDFAKVFATLSWPRLRPEFLQLFGRTVR